MWYMHLFYCPRRQRWILYKIWNSYNIVVDRQMRKRKQAYRKLPRMIAKVPKLWANIAFQHNIQAKQVIDNLVYLFQMRVGR